MSLRNILLHAAGTETWPSFFSFFFFFSGFSRRKERCRDCVQTNKGRLNTFGGVTGFFRASRGFLFYYYYYSVGGFLGLKKTVYYTGTNKGTFKTCGGKTQEFPKN